MAKDTIKISIESTRNYIGKSTIALIITEALRSHGFTVVTESNDANISPDNAKEISPQLAKNLIDLFIEKDVELIVSDKDVRLKNLNNHA